MQKFWLRIKESKGIAYLLKLWDFLGLLSACALVLMALWIFAQVFLFTSFSIPTDSMIPTLQPGDYVLVNKVLKGGRLFSLNDASDHKPLKITRVKGLEDFKRNEVLVFNFPYPERWDSVGFHVLRYYVKRCVAVPGDTLEIRDAHYRVRGYDGDLGNVRGQRSLSLYLKSKYNVEQMIRSGCYRAYPGDTTLGWNIREFGPLYVPSAGDTVAMNELHYLLYRRLIEWEQRKKLTKADDGFYLGNQRIEQYVFQKRYYFMAGDNCYNSQDSRYWGLLPEEYIVGKATRIWKSIEKPTGEVRWNRVMQKIE